MALYFFHFYGKITKEEVSKWGALARKHKQIKGGPGTERSQNKMMKISWKRQSGKPAGVGFGSSLRQRGGGGGGGEPFPTWSRSPNKAWTPNAHMHTKTHKSSSRQFRGSSRTLRSGTPQNHAVGMLKSKSDVSGKSMKVDQKGDLHWNWHKVKESYRKKEGIQFFQSVFKTTTVKKDHLNE